MIRVLCPHLLLSVVEVASVDGGFSWDAEFGVNLAVNGVVFPLGDLARQREFVGLLFNWGVVVRPRENHANATVTEFAGFGTSYHSSLH